MTALMWVFVPLVILAYLMTYHRWIVRRRSDRVGTLRATVPDWQYDEEPGPRWVRVTYHYLWMITGGVLLMGAVLRLPFLFLGAIYAAGIQGLSLMALYVYQVYRRHHRSRVSDEGQS